jgi:hypothetical protein
VSDQGIENRRRHDAGRAMVKDEEEAGPDLEPKQLTGAPATNEAAAQAAARDREEDPEAIGATPKLFTGDLPPLDDGGAPEQRRGGGDGGGAGAGAATGATGVAEEEAAIVVGHLAAWGVPPAPLAKHLRVLREPKTWVKI